MSKFFRAPRLSRPSSLAQAEWGNAVLLLPALVLLGIFYVVPMVEILRASIMEPKFGLQNYVELIASAPLRRIFGTTFRVSAETTSISLLLGYSVAYVLAHSAPRAAKLMMVFVLLPFWISALVRAFAWF
jgi:putative spermidine/putrescine transport system permease protein